MVAVEFEKDDDSNDHINFITACSVSKKAQHVYLLPEGFPSLASQ